MDELSEIVMSAIGRELEAKIPKGAKLSAELVDGSDGEALDQLIRFLDVEFKMAQ
jgi:hypothetical protein